MNVKVDRLEARAEEGVGASSDAVEGDGRDTAVEVECDEMVESDREVALDSAADEAEQVTVAADDGQPLLLLWVLLLLDGASAEVEMREENEKKADAVDGRMDCG